MTDLFARLLRRFRREAGLSQEALAERAGLSKDAVSALERGTRRAPHRGTVEDLADALDLAAPARAQFEGAASQARRDAAKPDRTPALHGFPHFGTPLVGRDEATRAVLAMLEQSRMVTIAGTGGLGKTRLAVAAASESFASKELAAWFVDLATARASADIVTKAASVFGARVSGMDDALEELVGALRARVGLIVLDNCEHLVEPAARAAAAILAKCPNLRVLATSRERLALDGERVYGLAPLSDSAGAELFDLRATALAPDYARASDRVEIARDICRQLDYIPLAIELASGLVPVLGPKELRARLRGQLGMFAPGRRDGPARQRTMHDTVAWSYALLGEKACRLFRELSAFAGGWTLDAVRSVATDTDDGDETLRTLSSLVDKSLVSVALDASPVRYRFLEPVRAFARARLDATAEAVAIDRRHAEWIARALERRRSDLAFVAGELDNVRVAIEWALSDGGDSVLAARIAGYAGGAYARLGLLGDARRFCEAALARLDGESHPELALALYRPLIVSMGGRDEIDAIVRAIPFARRAGDWNGVAVLTSRLALRYGERGRFDEADRAFERARLVGERFELHESAEWVTVLMHRASVYRRQGRLSEAQTEINASLALARTLRKPLHEMWALIAAGEIAFAREEMDGALEFAGEALDLCLANGHALGEIASRANLAGYYLALNRIADARTQARLSLERGRGAQDRIVLAAILHLAASAADGEASQRAAALKGYFDAVREREELALDPTEASSYAILAGALQRRLDARTLEATMRQGARMNGSDAADLALGL